MLAGGGGAGTLLGPAKLNAGLLAGAALLCCGLSAALGASPALAKLNGALPAGAAGAGAAPAKLNEDLLPDASAGLACDAAAGVPKLNDGLSPLDANENGLLGGGLAGLAGGLRLGARGGLTGSSLTLMGATGDGGVVLRCGSS